MSLFDLIYEYFESHIFNDVDGTDFLSNLYYPMAYSSDSGGSVFYITLRQWLCYTATFISITIIVVLCCLFIYKIIKLIGGLIR